MTGGAGFSRQAAQSFKDNHDLGRIRPQGKLELKARSGKNAEELQLKEAIIFRTQKRSEAKLLNRKIRLVIALIILIGFGLVLLFS